MKMRERDLEYFFVGGEISCHPFCVGGGMFDILYKRPFPEEK